MWATSWLDINFGTTSVCLWVAPCPGLLCCCMVRVGPWVSSATHINTVLFTIISAVLRNASRQGQRILPMAGRDGLLLMRSLLRVAVIHRCASRPLRPRHLLIVC